MHESQALSTNFYQPRLHLFTFSGKKVITFFPLEKHLCYTYLVSKNTGITYSTNTVQYCTRATLQLANSWLKSDRRAGLAAGLAAGGVNAD